MAVREFGGKIITNINVRRSVIKTCKKRISMMKHLFPICQLRTFFFIRSDVNENIDCWITIVHIDYPVETEKPVLGVFEKRQKALASLRSRYICWLRPGRIVFINYSIINWPTLQINNPNNYANNRISMIIDTISYLLVSLTHYTPLWCEICYRISWPSSFEATVLRMISAGRAWTAGLKGWSATWESWNGSVL